MAGYPAGMFDRRVTIEKRQTTKDPNYGTSVVSWVTHGKAWAQVRDVLPSKGESVDDNVNLRRRPARIRMRFREDITSDMRIVHRGRALEIVSGPVELGRREAIELMVQEFSTSGDAP